MWDTKKALLFSGVGIGLAASSAILYILYKKDDIYNDFKKSDNVATSRQSVIRVDVPKDMVGTIIGRQGANIKEIQKKTNTRISFENQGAGDNVKRIAVIRGSPEEAQDAENIINSMIINQPIILTENVYVPQGACGRIIGKNGDSIRYLCQVSHAKIVVDRPDDHLDGMRCITITGSKEDIECAKILIDEKIAEEEAFLQNVERSSAVRMPRYKGRQLSIEGQKIKNGLETDENKMQESLVPTASDGFIEAYISSVESPNRFWVQLVGTKSSQLDRMVEDMTSFYNIQGTQEVLAVRNLTVGSIVASPFALDTSWYRARVLSIEENAYSEDEAKVTVYYVDFGDEGQVARSRLCVLSPEYLVIPFQAIECSLAHVDPLDGIWSNEATEYFSQITCAAQWTVIMCKPVDYAKKEGEHNQTVYSVELIDTNGKSDVNIAEQLVKKGFAIWNKIKLKKMVSE